MSKGTLEIVNATLQIAKEESDRRAKSIEAKAKETLGELDGQATFLVSRIPEDDVHELASNPTLRSELSKLARRIDGFETNRLIFQETPELTPHILFIRGMDFHFNQNFEGSLASWKQVVVDKESSDELKSLAWYWMGREQNNLAKFEEAEQSFANARRSASAVMDFELQRNILESKFFNKDKGKAADLIEPLQKLLNRVAPGGDANGSSVSRVRGKVLTTLGNVRIEAGDECGGAGSQEARDHYESALDIFEQARDQDKWALFGKAEALYSLGRFDEAYPIYRDKLRRQAVDEYHRRVEPRARTVARTLELICCIRVPDLWKDVPTASENVLASLDEVDENLTVYSEIWHRNVSKPRFRGQIEQLMREWEERRSQPPTA